MTRNTRNTRRTAIEDDTPVELPPTRRTRARRAKASADVTPADVTPADVTPSDVTPSDITPADVTPSDVTPSDITPADVTPSDITPADVTPSDITPADVTPSDVTPADVTPGVRMPRRPSHPDYVAPSEDSVPVKRSANSDESSDEDTAPKARKPKRARVLTPAEVEKQKEIDDLARERLKTSVYMNMFRAREAVKQHKEGTCVLCGNDGLPAEHKAHAICQKLATPIVLIAHNFPVLPVP
jgi:hypothetical protein